MTKFDNNDFHENFEKEYTLKEQKVTHMRYFLIIMIQIKESVNLVN